MIKLSEVRAQIEKYIGDSQDKNRNKLLALRDIDFSENQIKVAIQFLNTLLSQATPLRKKNCNVASFFNAPKNMVQAIIVRMRKALLDLALLQIKAEFPKVTNENKPHLIAFIQEVKIAYGFPSPPEPFEENVSDGGVISTYSLKTTLHGFVADLLKGKAGTHLYQLIYSLHKSLCDSKNEILIDIGIYDSKGSVNDELRTQPKDASLYDMTDPNNPAITNRML